MTRKHFQALAENLNYQYRVLSTAQQKAIFWLAVVAVADTCKQSNSRFQRERFYHAVKGEK